MPSGPSSSTSGMRCDQFRALLLGGDWASARPPLAGLDIGGSGQVLFRTVSAPRPLLYRWASSIACLLGCLLHGFSPIVSASVLLLYVFSFIASFLWSLIHDLSCIISLP